MFLFKSREQQLKDILQSARGTDGREQVQNLKHLIESAGWSQSVNRMGLIEGFYAADTLLTYCAAHGFVCLVQMLVEDFDADPNVTDRWGLTPLMVAAKHGEYIVCRYLVRLHDIDILKINLKDKNRAALDYARLHDEQRIVSLLETEIACREQNDDARVQDRLSLMDQVAQLQQRNRELEDEIHRNMKKLEEYDGIILSLKRRLKPEDRIIIDDSDSSSNIMASSSLNNLPEWLFAQWYRKNFVIQPGNIWWQYYNHLVSDGLNDMFFWMRLVDYQTGSADGLTKQSEFDLEYVLTNVLAIVNPMHVKKFIKSLVRYKLEELDPMSDWFLNTVHLGSCLDRIQTEGYEDLDQFMQQDLSDDFLKSFGIDSPGYRLRIRFYSHLMKRGSIIVGPLGGKWEERSRSDMWTPIERLEERRFVDKSSTFERVIIQGARPNYFAANRTE